MPLVALITVVAAGCSGSHRPSGGPGPSTSISATAPTTEPPPQYAPSPYAWDRATSSALAVGGGPTATLAAVLAPQITGSWLVLGSRTGSGGAPTATVWSSPDATTWTASELDAVPGPSQIRAAARYKTETVAVGSTGSGVGQQAAVWLSAETGSPLTPQSVPDSNGPSSMTLVSAGALGMFAAGTVDGRFALWSSTNGRQWSEVPGGEKVITSSPGARVNALIAEGDFEYAAGSVQPGPVPEAAVWSTSDGLNWHLVGSAAQSFSGAGGRVIYSLAPLGTGLVAVGAMDGPAGWVPASWISPDGQSWSLPSLDFPSVPHPSAGQATMGPSGGTAARSVAAIPTLIGTGGVVAAGGGPYGQAAWRSADGIHWSSLSMPPGQAAATSWRAEGAAATADTAVVVDSEPGQPYLLTDHPGALPGAGANAATVPTSPVGTATGAGTGGTSQADVAIPGSWGQPSSDPHVFGPVQAQAVPVALASGGGRLELTVDLLSRPQSIGPAAVTTMVLSSPDGSTWAASPAGTSQPGAPSVPPAPGALALHLPGGWVSAVSPPGSTPQVWTSSDGRSWGRVAELSAPTAGTGAGTDDTTTTAGPTGAYPAGAGATVANGMCALRLSAASTPSATIPTGTAASPPPTTSTAAVHQSSTTTQVTAPARYTVAVVGSSASSSIPPPGSTGGATASVGSVAVTTRSAAAWFSAPGGAWRYAPAGGAPPAGGTSSMSGCLASGSGLVAFGAGTAGGGVPVPAIWRSPDGGTWTRVAVSAFNNGPSSPIVSMATAGDYWLAAATPDPGSDPFRPEVAGGPGPTASVGDDAGVGPPPTVDDGRDALWLSTASGTAWQLINTFAAPWLGTQRSQIDLTGFLPAAAVHATSTSVSSSTTSAPAGLGPTSSTSSTVAPSSSTSSTVNPSTNAPVPVVVGVVDGQLAVWTGTAAPAGSSGGS